MQYAKLWNILSTEAKLATSENAFRTSIIQVNQAETLVDRPFAIENHLNMFRRFCNTLRNVSWFDLFV